jgi:hypothetical protein
MNPDDRKSLGKAGRTAEECYRANVIRLERDLHKQICNDLTRREIVFYHSRTDRKSTIGVGLPDFAFALNGCPLAIEVKLPGEKLTPQQETVCDLMRQNGWHVHTVHSFDEFLAAIRHF